MGIKDMAGRFAGSQAVDVLVLATNDGALFNKERFHIRIVSPKSHCLYFFKSSFET